MFRSIICWCVAPVIELNGPWCSTPAQFTSTSTVSFLRATALASLLAAPGSARSAASTWPVTPNSVFSRWRKALNLSTLLATKMASYPACEKQIASASPIPDEAPVINTVGGLARSGLRVFAVGRWGRTGFAWVVMAASFVAVERARQTGLPNHHMPKPAHLGCGSGWPVSKPDARTADFIAIKYIAACAHIYWF